MERYRIVKVPKIDSEPICRIETWGTVFKWSVWRGTSESEGWVFVDINGNPIRLVPGRPNCQTVMKLFNTYASALNKVEAIIEYLPKQKEVVFDTLTANPPTETGT